MDAGGALLLLLLAVFNLAHVAAYATTRFRLPFLPVVFLVAATALTGGREGRLLPLRGGRLALFLVLLVLTLLVLRPGLDELATWRLFTGRAAG